MGIKWKIFFALNVIVGLISFILLILLLVFFGDINPSSEDYVYLIIFLFVLSVMTINEFLNILLLQRYYPDKMLTKGIRTLYSITSVFSILIVVLLLLGCIISAHEEFGDNKTRSTSGRIAWIIMAAITVLQLIILIMQGQLLRLLRRNHQNTMHSLIDSIGQPEAEEN